MPSASFAFESLATRLGDDLRTRFPAITVRVRQSDDDEMVCEVDDGGVPWGEILLDATEDDEFSPSEVESFIARAVTDITDNLWPDDLVDPWPLCPVHLDHPLQPALVHRRAAWRCLRDNRTVVVIGELAGKSTPPRP